MEMNEDEKEARVYAGCSFCDFYKLKGYELICLECLDYWLRWVRPQKEKSEK